MGREGRKQRVWHLRGERCGVPRADGTDPPVPGLQESRGLDWVWICNEGD